MKAECRIAVIFCAIAIFAGEVMAQNSGNGKTETLLRRLDQQAAEAILQRDEKQITQFFTTDSVTNNPRNGLTRGSRGVVEAARSGLIDYHSFERNLESIQILGNTAVLMGNEKVVWRGKDGQAGETVRRRYTNIWMKRGREWKIVARHANVICQ